MDKILQSQIIYKFKVSKYDHLLKKLICLLLKIQQLIVLIELTSVFKR